MLNRLKILLFSALLIFLNLSCEKSDDDVIFSFDSVIRLNVPAGLPPLLTHTFADILSRHEVNIDSALAERGLTSTEVRIRPSVATLDILNDSDWRFARGAEILFQENNREFFPIFLSDEFNRSERQTWVINSFNRDLTPYSSSSYQWEFANGEKRKGSEYYVLQISITPAVSNRKLLDLLITTRYSVLRS